MIWAQWGLKDRLVSNPDVWLCDQCNDCSQTCPRNAKPGDVMGAIRSEAVVHYATPGFLGRALDQPKYLPLLFAIPILILLAFMGSGSIALPDGPVIFEHFVPHWVIYAIFIPLTVFIIATALSGLARFWKDAKRSDPGSDDVEEESTSSSFIAAAMEIAKHSRFNDCEEAKGRFLGHLLVFWGFMALLVATTLVVVGLYGLHWELPLAFLHPVKILGNVGALALIIGLAMCIGIRLNASDKGGRGSYFDWLFIIVLMVVGLTGVLTEAGREAGAATVAYGVYLVHLVFVFFLLAYMPFSKFAHLMYRTAALVRAKQTDRYRERSRTPAGEGTSE